MRPSSIVFLNDFCIRYIQSEIETLVAHGASECWGTYNATTQIGYGASYENACIHSGSSDHSGGDAVWYNYAIASASTVINKDTSSSNPAVNINTATESLCPKGWSLPFNKQMSSNTGSINFNPVLGGLYSNGVLTEESRFGVWWGSEAYNTARRHSQVYNNNILYTNNDRRYQGVYIRCVSEEKTVTDLTYMQDMTPQIAATLSLCI